MRTTLSLLLALLPLAAGSASADGTAYEVTGGAASFVVGTNLSAVSVHGKSNRLAGLLSIHENGKQLVLENIEVQLDSGTLSTGMKLRDRHMREKVFTAADGTVPEVRFRADKALCPTPAAGETTCNISGKLLVRGAARPFQMVLKVRSEDNSAGSYRVSGESVVKLTDYGVEPPAQLGVRVADTVNVRVEFTARQKRDHAAQR